jgi:hypothetical protein
VHTVVETPHFISAARSAGMTDELRSEVVRQISENPELGDLIEGTGGFRKFRVARPGRGKSGGYRVISYYYALGIPVFLITVFAKNQQANLTKAERNALGRLSQTLVETYSAKGKTR